MTIRTGQEFYRGEPHWIAFSEEDVRVYAAHPLKEEAVRLAEEKARKLTKEEEQ